jgi:drug/metabolite transporter (DMT)-like permease
LSGEVTALLSAILYALSYLLLRKGQAETKMDEFDNGLFLILLVSGSALSLALIAGIWMHPTPLVSGKDWLFSVSCCIMAGLVGTLCGRLALFAAIAKIGATRGVIVNAMAPIVTLVIAITTLGERFQLFDIWGMALLLFGMFLLMLERSLFPTRFLEHLYKRGLVVAILATLFQGIGYTFRKVGIDTSMTPLFAATLDTVAAFAVYVLFLAAFGRLKTVVSLSLRNLNLNIAAAGILSGAAVLLFFAATDAIPVSQVSMITGSQPVIVALLSSIFMKKLERITWVTLGSAIFVALGVALIGM